MRISSAFPSNYLKAADLQGREITVTIDHVKMEDVGDDNKPVVYFVGKERGVVLNKTNANNISHLYGDDTDGWHGRQVTLYETMTDFQGRSVPAIRIKPPPRQQAAHHETSPPPRRPVGGISDNYDPISSGPPPGHPAHDAPPADDIPF